MARIKLNIQRPWIPYIIFIVTLALSLLATYYITNQTHTEDRLRFFNAVQDTNTNLKTKIDTYVALLRGTAGFYTAEPAITKQLFTNYVDRLKLTKNYPGAMGLGFIQKVENANKDTFIQAAQQQDNESIIIKPAGNRSEYYVVRYLIRSDDKNPTSIGMDLATNPILKRAMETARDSGLSTASGLETIYDKATKKNVSVFLIFTPVYLSSDIPSTVAQRRNTLEGFVFIPFRVDRLLNEINANKTLPQLVNYQIYDDKQLTAHYLLYNSYVNHNHDQSAYLPRFDATRTFIIGSNTWTVHYTNNPQFDLESAKNLSAVIFIGGLLVSIMFFLLSRSQYIARNKAEIAASKLQASQNELQKAISHRDNFISIASHELKTPVTSLKVYAELLLRQFAQKDESKSKDYLIKVNRQIDKLTILIQDLLNVSRIQKNQLTFRMEQCDINELAKEAVENTQQITDRHTIILEGQIKRKIICDKERISQVIVNLLTNAIKYSPAADKIVVTLKENKNQAIISVRDFGIGISKEHHKKVFDRFYRISDTDGQTYPGLGIGLFISQAIIKRHGGEITILSEKGSGSTFQFNLPFKKKNSDTTEKA